MSDNPSGTRQEKRGRVAAPLMAWSLLASLALALATPTLAAEGGKKGVGVNEKAPFRDQLLCLSRGLWYYNWSLTPSSPGQTANFVPMVRGGGDMETVLHTQPTRQFDTLLLFNEPNKPKESSLSATPAQLAQYTAELAPYAKFLVSPAPLPKIRPWFSEYMATGEARNDLGAVAIHWYGPADFNVFRAYIQSVEQAFRKPIWLTEFAVVDDGQVYSQADTVRFLDQALPYLDQDPMVQRYAWFGLRGKNGRPYKDSGFTDDEGRLTPVGQRYLLSSMNPGERMRRLAECHMEPET